MEDAMNISRRVALASGLTLSTMPFLARSAGAVPKAYGPEEGKELSPGVRMIELGTRDSNIAAYKTVQMVDIVYQPGAADPPGEVMEADMVCQTIVGELEVTAGEQKFTAKEGDVWSCGKGSTKESAANKGSEAAVMRIIMMHA
jgi:quercetin dioxygenase-like cupin family protein